MTSKHRNVSWAKTLQLAGSVLLALTFWAGTASAQSPFDGTWRPDPQRADPNDKPDGYTLSNGVYACAACNPPYRVKADGTAQPVIGNAHYDALSVTVIDDRTVVRTARKQGKIVATTKATVSADGATLIETQTVSGMSVRPFEMASTLMRVSPGPAGSHRISGEWRLVESDLVNHEEDTTYKLDGGTMTMSDRFGRSFAAKLDGTDAPYRGDPHYTTVSLELLGPRTLQETDKRNGTVVQINRWTVDADGTTLHAQFDDTHGSVQHQTGHKLPAGKP